MKIVLIVAATLGALIALILVVGAMLPRRHQAIREITLHRPAREVYATARDFGSGASWRPDLQRVEMLDAARFREHSKNGTVTYEILEDIPDAKVVTRIVDRDLGYSGSWTYEFLPAENGTRVRITEDGEVSNIFFRFMSRFVFGHTSTIDGYLTALGRKFGETVTPST